MKVWLIGRTFIPSYQVGGPSSWLEHLGVDPKDRATALVSPDSFFSDEERLIILAAKRCYKSFKPGLNPNVTKVRDDPKDFIYNILKSGHGFVLEHASATFALEGISRVCTHELVRHRTGVAVSQESLRYVKLEEFDLITPPEFEEDGNFLARKTREYLLREIRTGFQEMQSELGREGDSFDRKKKITSAVRRIIPMGVSTGMVWTANFRALRWVLEQRTAPAAEWEIRRLFNAVGDICLSSWPLVFQDFKKVPCEDYPDLFSFVPEFSKV